MNRGSQAFTLSLSLFIQMNFQLALASFLALGLVLASEQQPQASGVTTATITTTVQPEVVISPMEQLTTSLTSGNIDDFKAELSKLYSKIDSTASRNNLLRLVCEFGDVESVEMVNAHFTFRPDVRKDAQVVASRAGNIEALLAMCGKSVLKAFQFILDQTLSQHGPTSSGCLNTLPFFLEIYPQMAEMVTNSRLLAKAIEHGQLDALRKLREYCPNLSLEKVNKVAYNMAVQNGHANMIEFLFAHYVKTSEDFAEYLCAAAQAKKPAAFKALVSLGNQTGYIDNTNVEQVTLSAAAAFQYALLTENAELKKTAISLIMDPMESLQARLSIMMRGGLLVAMDYFEMQLVFKNLGLFFPREVLELIVSNNLESESSN